MGFHQICGFPKIGVPLVIIHSNGIFPYKPSMYSHLWKPPYSNTCFDWHSHEVQIPIHCPLKTIQRWDLWTPPFGLLRMYPGLYHDKGTEITIVRDTSIPILYKDKEYQVKCPHCKGPSRTSSNETLDGKHPYVSPSI